jgi:hypothetical protein
VLQAVGRQEQAGHRLLGPLAAVDIGLRAAVGPVGAAEVAQDAVDVALGRRAHG